MGLRWAVYREVIKTNLPDKEDRLTDEQTMLLLKSCI